MTPPADLRVLYGSETGTAEEVAGYVASLARRRCFENVETQPLDDINPSLLCINAAIPVLLVISTTGDGEVPENMKRFWRWLLRRGLAADALSSLRFAVFGLGDTTYGPKFNAAARKLHARLLQLGASELAPRGLGDEQSPQGVWGDLDAWLSGVWAALLAVRPLPPGYVPDDGPALAPPLLDVEFLSAGAGIAAGVEAEGRKDLHSELNGGGAGARSGGDSVMPFPARVLENRRLTAACHQQDVRHIELDVLGMAAAGRLRPGDVAVVHPQNDSTAVAAFAALFGLDLDAVVEIRAAGGTAAPEGAAAAAFLFPRRCTVRQLLMSCLDIAGIPRRLFFERLAPHATDPDEREKLAELASPAGADLLHAYAARERRSCLEVLQDFPSCRPPLARLLEVVPRLRPRHFSVASSPLAHPGRVHLCVAVVAYRTPLRRAVAGVCSTWLAGLRPAAPAGPASGRRGGGGGEDGGGGDTVPLWLRPGSFEVPASPDDPVVLVGPGT
ncbi:unnamed protein product, partial [Phaeothamnion confervicola]